LATRRSTTVRYLGIDVADALERANRSRPRSVVVWPITLSRHWIFGTYCDATSSASRGGPPTSRFHCAQYSDLDDSDGHQGVRLRHLRINLVSYALVLDLRCARARRSTSPPQISQITAAYPGGILPLNLDWQRVYGAPASARYWWCLPSRPVQQQDKDPMNPRSSQQSAEGDSRRFPPVVTVPRADLALGVPMIR
jgi:hypothetical protein